MSALPDLEGRSDLDGLLCDFYRLVLSDPLLRPVFVDVMHIDLDRHLPVLGAFWEHVLFRTGTYGGQTMEVHRRVHGRAALTEAHFDCWLELWRRSVDARFAGPVADQAKAHATRMAPVFLRSLDRPAGRRSLQIAPARR